MINLKENEIIFLKFLQNKKSNIEFSSRWEWQYNINIDDEISKLVKMNYLICDEYFILTQKGKEIIEDNKRLFMTDKEKAGNEFKELTNLEYKQLSVFKKLSKYKQLKHNELSFDKGYSKNDVLWAIYNEQKDVYIRKKDYVMVSVVYQRMYELLCKEKNYKDALNYLICYTYLRNDLDFFDKEFFKINKKYEVTLTSEFINSCISKYLGNIYDDFKVSWLKENILKNK